MADIGPAGAESLALTNSFSADEQSSELPTIKILGADNVTSASHTVIQILADFECTLYSTV